MSLPKDTTARPPSTQSIHPPPTDIPPDPDQDDHDDHNQPEPNTSPQFQPFFTLIEDEHTSEYFHPTVHYIFSDDDTDIVTEASLRSLENEHDIPPGRGGTNLRKDRDGQDSSHSQSHSNSNSNSNANSRQSETDPASPRKSILPPPIPGVRENYIILDIDRETSSENAETGAGTGAGEESITSPPRQAEHPNRQYKVTSAQSLTPTWQVLDTALVPAPTFENNATEGSGGGGGGGMMLKIHGSRGLPGTIGREREKGSQRLEEMMDQFARRMDELRTVIQAGGREVPTETEVEAGAEGAEGKEGDQGEETKGIALETTAQGE